MSANPEIIPRRGGAREARRAARSAELPDHLKPVRPGMSGGRYKPLSDADVLKIHHAALDALEAMVKAKVAERCKGGAKGTECWP